MRSYTITKIWGIPIKVNTSLLIFLPILVYLIAARQQIQLYAGVIEDLTGTGFSAGSHR